MGIVSPKTMLWQGLAFLFCGCLAGLFLVFTRGTTVLWLGLFGVLTGFFYTAPPFRLVATGIGELFIGLDFGVLMVLGAYYTQATRLSMEAAAASLPVALLISAVLYINEFQDMAADQAVGKNQLVVRLGRRSASIGYGLLMGLTYGSLILGVVLAGVSPFALLGLLTVGLAWQGYQIARANYDDPVALAPANAATIKNHLLTGLLMSLGYVVELVVR
jgi:1,4-dihydroxy-2-naphthoate octaprenyltransferase